MASHLTNRRGGLFTTFRLVTAFTAALALGYAANYLTARAAFADVAYEFDPPDVRACVNEVLRERRARSALELANRRFVSTLTLGRIKPAGGPSATDKTTLWDEVASVSILCRTFRNPGHLL